MKDSRKLLLKSRFNNIGARLSTVVLVLSLFWLSIAGSWTVCSSFNFAFPILYDVVEIDQNIEEFGPKNRYKDDFEITTDEERMRLFAMIVKSVNADGEGLKELVYVDPQGRVIDMFLTEPERVHLQDVANLITAVEQTLVIFILIAVVCAVFIYYSGMTPPSTLRVFLYGSGVIGLAAVIIVVSGAESVFYDLHTLVFPEGHQWFFYYQESLMTMLMKAPVIFAYITPLLFLISLLIFAALWRMFEYGLQLSRSRHANS